jgi:hypothetical protein
VIAATPCTPTVAAAAPAWGRALRGDVDGDGRRDVVSLRIDRRHPARCGVTLLVQTQRGPVTTRVSYPLYGHDARWFVETRASFPFVNGLYALDRRRGLEIVVTAWEGASNWFLQLYAIRNGHLVRLRLPRDYGDALSWGGFAAAYGGVDCAHGLIRVSTAWNTRGRRWRVARTFYRVGRRRVTLVRSQQLRGGIAITARYAHELSQRAPFPSCHGVPSRRRAD